jgi:glycerol-3-phosphate O-acyltransferase/dihydroxyacetone phosphate acyltransferase
LVPWLAFWTRVSGYLIGLQLSLSIGLEFPCLVSITRAQDEAKAGTGLVTLSPDDPCVVIGIGTKFTKELAPKKKITLPKSVGGVSAEVVEVISDTEVKVKREFASDSGKGTSKIRLKIEAAGGQGLTFKVIPYINHEAIYRHVYLQLKEGGCIGIFPEGTRESSQKSHSCLR